MFASVSLSLPHANLSSFTPHTNTYRHETRKPLLSPRFQLSKTNSSNMAATHKDDSEKRFVQWLKDSNVDFCNLKLEKVGGDMDIRYGTLAGEKGIEKGSIVVKVPRKIFMNQETASQCPLIGPMVLSSELNDWQILCLHLLTQIFYKEKSFWNPYLKMLPSMEEMKNLHPMLWDENFRSKWLKGSPLLSKINTRLEQCKQDFDQIHSTLIQKTNSNNEDMVKFIHEFTSEDVVYASSILLSRAFYLEMPEMSNSLISKKLPKLESISEFQFDIENELEYEYEFENEFENESDSFPVLNLVPWADILNHDSQCGSESCLTFDFDSECAILHAHRSYNEHAQVFDSYGVRLSKSQLFLDYGFVDRGNTIDAVEIPANEAFEVKDDSNLSLLNAIGLSPNDAVFAFSSEGLDESMLSWSRAAMASESDLKLSKWLSPRSISSSSAKNNRKKGRGKHKHKRKDDDEDEEGMVMRAANAMAYFCKPVSKENETKVLSKLLEAIQNQLGKYQNNDDNNNVNNINDDNNDNNNNDNNDVHYSSHSGDDWKRIQSLRIKESEKNALIQSIRCLEERILNLNANAS